MDPNTHNRAETGRLLDISVKLLGARDFLGSKTFAIRAKECDPSNEVSDQILAVVETVLAGENRVNSAQHPDWYSVLQLPRLVRDPELIANHYRRLATLLNPERNRFPFSDYALQLVMDAWSILSDPSKKWLFDSELGLYIQRVVEPPLPPPPPPPPAVQPVAVSSWQQSQNLSQGLSQSQFMQPSHELPPQWRMRDPTPAKGGNRVPPMSMPPPPRPVVVAPTPPVMTVPMPVGDHGNFGGSSDGRGNVGVGMNGGEGNKGYSQMPRQVVLGAVAPPQQSQASVVQPTLVDDGYVSVNNSNARVLHDDDDVGIGVNVNGNASAGVNVNVNVNVNADDEIGGNENDFNENENVGVDENVNANANDFANGDGNGVKEGNDGGVEEEVVESFWTSCPYCLYIFEYEKMYKECTLICQNCRKGFQGVQIPDPPLNSGSDGGGGGDKGKESSFCCWGFFPLGFSMTEWKKQNRIKKPNVGANWVPFSPMFACPGENEAGDFKLFDSSGGGGVGPKNLGRTPVSRPRVIRDEDDDFISEPSDSDSSDNDWRIPANPKKRKSKRRGRFGPYQAPKVIKREGLDVKHQAANHRPVTRSRGGVSIGGKDLEGDTNTQDVASGLTVEDKDVPRKETPGEEIPTNEVPGKEVPRKEIPRRKVAATPASVTGTLTRSQARRMKNMGRLDLNVELNNEGDEHAATVNSANEEDTGVENIAFFEGLDEFFSTLPILNAGGDEKAKPS